ncbi:MAG: flagellar motor protein MotB [Bryobacteraceae bacterium]
MPRRRHTSHDNRDRWLVSYADFITLLFAFFVVLDASAEIDRTRARAVSEAVERALHEGQPVPRAAILLGGTVDDKGKGNALHNGPGGAEPSIKEVSVKAAAPPTPPQVEELLPSMKLLTAALAGEIAKGEVRLKLQRRGLVIGLQAGAFFASGDDTVKRSAYPTITKVAGVLNRLPNALRLEGHTDSLPINTPRFHSNWELSAARSIAMLRLLHQKYGVALERMAIVGYADTRAAHSNQTPEGRAKNRRVDIVIVSQYGMRAEPGQQDAEAPGAGNIQKTRIRH